MTISRSPKFRSRVNLLLLALFFLLVLAPGSSEPAGKKVGVNGIRHWSNPNYTRIVIDLDGKTGYTYTVLKKDPSIDKPRRLYVDIEAAVLGKNISKSVHIGDGLLKQARAGQFDRDTVRVVLDIESIDDYKIFSLVEPYRIVIDVYGDASLSAPVEETAIESEPLETWPKTEPVDSKRKRRLTIVLDPGHGGKDPGAIGRRGLREKDVTLRIAKMLKERLSRQTKAKIVLTRTKDVYIPLEQRTAIANSNNADLFISIHVNASPRRAAAGIETYILNITNDEGARRVAARENAISQKALSDLEFILMDLIKSAKGHDSARMATIVHASLVKRLQKKYRKVHSNGVKGAPFYVLVGTRMPSILVEVSFISNAREERRLRSSKYLRELVEGLSSGVKEYIKSVGLG
jgi:N-acetylmuramoyl-L-alanine amidase